MQYQVNMPRSFRDALLDALETTRTSMKVVAEKSGVSYEQLKKVKQREAATTNVDDAVRVANFFGVTLDEFLQDDTAQVRSEIVALYMQLSDSERELLRAAARGRAALDSEAKG